MRLLFFASAIAVLIICDNAADALDKSCRIELRTKNLIGTVRKDSDTPVADEGYQLLMLGGLDFGTKVFGIFYSGLALYIDQDKIVRTDPKH